MDKVLKFFDSHGDRSIYLDKINLLDVYVALELCKEKLDEKMSLLILSVTVTFDEIIQHYANEKEEFYE